MLLLLFAGYFIASIYLLGCCPLIDKPTIVTNDNTLIDNILQIIIILINIMEYYFINYIINDTSDHYSVLTFFDLNFNNFNKKQTNLKLIYKKIKKLHYSS